MLITKEQQEAWVSNYAKKGHSNDECIGFIDGVNKALDAVNKNFVKPDVSGSVFTRLDLEKAFYGGRELYNGFSLRLLMEDNKNIKPVYETFDDFMKRGIQSKNIYR